MQASQDEVIHVPEFPEDFPKLAYGLALAGASLVFLGSCMGIVHLLVQINQMG